MKKIVIALVFIAGVIGLIFIPSFLAGGSSGGPNSNQETSATVFTVRTENAEIRTLQAYIEVNANIVSGNQVTVMPDANGRLVSMRVGLGDIVQRGTLIAEIDPSRPGTPFSLSPVYAPVSGRVVTTPQSVGSTVSTAASLMTLAVNGSLEIEALIPEREAGQLRTGLTAQVRLEAFPGEIFPATLTLVSPVIDPVSRTRKITLQFDRQTSGLYDPRIVPGMFARVRLNTRTYQDVVSIPQEALVEHRGRTIVFVVGNDVVQAREINTGAVVDREVEILSGLNSGEAVVVQGQQFLTDGAAVRVLGGRP